MKLNRKIISLLAVGGLCTALLGGCGRSNENFAVEGEPLAISVWHYYNGVQQVAFDKMVEEFNDTLGKEKGILVESYSQGNVEGLLQVVLDAADKKQGVGPMPNICSAYGDTAYEMYQRGLTADIAPYFTEKDRKGYISSYFDEGSFQEGEMTIFPIAKATQVLVLNQTDFEEFAGECQVEDKMFSTYQQLAQLAQMYYEWTDAKTSQPDDGKAFFGSDSMANLFFAGAKQLGVELLEEKDGSTVLNFEREVIREIWDNYYIPYVKGYFYKGGRFSSDDMKSGGIIAYIGSSSGASYVPREVMKDDNTSYPIEVTVMPAPVMEGGKKIAIQQGAGMCVMNTSQKEVEASMIFLKWFTASERNVRFATDAGYMPVTCDADTFAELDSAFGEMTDNVSRNMAEISTGVMNEWDKYAPKGVPKGTEVRAILEDAMALQAQTDRAAVEEAVSGGVPAREAYESFLTQEHFEEWYNTTKAAIEGAIQ